MSLVRRSVRCARFVGNAALWLVAAVGLIAGSFWLAGRAELVHPLVVISGSMEPGIDTGDLLIATRVDTADLAVGDIVSLPSDYTDHLVTHRIISIDAVGDGTWRIEMQGDANDGPDIAPYIVGDEVWSPAVRLPGVGSMISTVTQPSVVVPGVLALVAFFGFALLDDDDEDEDEDAAAGVATGHRDTGGSDPGGSDPGTDGSDDTTATHDAGCADVEQTDDRPRELAGASR